MGFIKDYKTMSSSPSAQYNWFPTKRLSLFLKSRVAQNIHQRVNVPEHICEKYGIKEQTITPEYYTGKKPKFCYSVPLVKLSYYVGVDSNPNHDAEFKCSGVMFPTKHERTTTDILMLNGPDAGKIFRGVNFSNPLKNFHCNRYLAFNGYSSNISGSDFYKKRDYVIRDYVDFSTALPVAKVCADDDYHNICALENAILYRKESLVDKLLDAFTNKTGKVVQTPKEEFDDLTSEIMGE